jgi:ribosomal-protein-serine acetyltransferase
MLTRELMPGVVLRLPEERDANELYALVDANRAYLSQWMPWAPEETLEDALSYIKLLRAQLANNDGLNTLITVDGRIAGSVGMRSIEWRVRSTELGYWLAAEHQGRGIMTAAVGAYLDYAFGVLGLHRVVVHAGTGNSRSRAIPERLGFTYEGTAREAEWLGERVHDLAVYAILASDRPARTHPGA